MSNERYASPKQTTGDSARNLVRAVLSPIAGADELLSYIWKQPFDKRLEIWRVAVADALRQLESRQEIDLSRIHLNEDFISVFIQASAIAVRSHQAEKIDALKNAVVNAALPGQTKVDFYFVFVRYVDELSPVHMKLLSFSIQEETTLKSLKSYSEFYNLFNDKYPKALSRDEFKMICGDLEVRGLLRISQDIDNFKDIYHADTMLLAETNDNLPRIIVTDIAKEFIKFIAEKP